MTEKRSIPELRDRLREIAQETGLEELNQIADEMYRRPAVRRAKPRSPAVSPEMAEEIRRYAWEHQELHLHDVAHHFHVNPGRVSEALHSLH